MTDEPTATPAPAAAAPAPEFRTPEGQKIATMGKRPKAAVVRNGVWQPLRLFSFVRPKPSETREGFLNSVDRVDELQEEAERTERSLQFLRDQVRDQEARLEAINRAKAKAAAEAASHLAKMQAAA